MRLFRLIAASASLGALFLAPAALATTNRQAMCNASLRCTQTTGAPSCGDGAACIINNDLLAACGSNGDNGISASGEGRCLTQTQVACLSDRSTPPCVDRDVSTPPASQPTTLCCNCTIGSQQLCAQFTDITSCGSVQSSQQYTLLAARNPNPVNGITCTPVTNESQCRPITNQGVCRQGPASLSSFFPATTATNQAAAGSAAGRRTAPPAQAPSLGVAIPGLTFSPPGVNVNYLGEYIAAAYRFGLAIVLIVATIMVTYGGFRYLIGSSTGDIKTGKEIIQDAVIGMLIVLGAYVILQTVNPATLSLQLTDLTPIRGLTIDEQLNVTPFDTSDPDNSNEVTGGPVGTGHLDSHGIVTYDECPVQLVDPPSMRNPNVNPRAQQFVREFVPTVANMPVWDCVQHVAAAAAKCDLWFGSCGATGNYINRLCNYNNGRGGQGRSKFNLMNDQELRSIMRGPCANLNNSGGSAGGAIMSEESQQISSELPFMTSSGGAEDSGDNRSVQSQSSVDTQAYVDRALRQAMARYDRVIRNTPGHDWQNINTHDTRVQQGGLRMNEYHQSREDFQRTAEAHIRATLAEAARRNVCFHIHPPRERVLAALQSRAGWGQPWYDALEPGDQFWIYNGNYGDTFGMHTMIFMGWVNRRAGLARTVNGGVPPRVTQFDVTLRGAGGLIVNLFTTRPRQR
jgi:hypothetical protein